MNAIPPAADLSKLKGILGNAKALMQKVESTSPSNGMNKTTDSQGYVDTSEYISESEIPQQHQGQTQAQGLNPVRKMGSISQEAIANSNMPEAIKKAMLESPIAQPSMNHTFNVEDVAELLGETPKPVAKTKKAPVTEQVAQQSNGNITVNEASLRGIIKDVLIEYLTADYSKNLTEGVIKKTINTLIKEGKIKTKAK